MPMLKLPLTVVSQPLGGPEDGSMPSSTAWARLVAAKSSDVRQCATRMVKGLRRVEGMKDSELASENRR